MSVMKEVQGPSLTEEIVNYLKDSKPTTDQPFGVRKLERTFRVRHGTISRILNTLAQEDPDFQDPRPQHSPDRILHRDPAGSVSVGRILRSEEIKMIPSRAFDILEQAGIKVERTKHRRKGRPVHRYLLEGADALKAKKVLQNFKPLPARH